MKKYVLSKLGYPVVEVEIAEDQWETVLKVTGNFIAHYFSKEQKFAYFYTTGLQTTYDLPNDAYWVQEVAWDPVTTSIDQIFSAESFLFCFANDLLILTGNDELINIEQWKDEYRAKTPFGPCKIGFDLHEHPQDLVEILYDGGLIHCTPNQPIKVNGLHDMLGDWKLAQEIKEGDGLTGPNGIVSAKNIRVIEKAPTKTIYATGAHCFYGCHAGKPILVH
jgi:hypothetical protein